MPPMRTDVGCTFSAAAGAGGSSRYCCFTGAGRVSEQAASTSEAPATMIAELTARALERSKAFARVVPPGYSSEADWVLDGFVSALYADERDGKKVSADVAVSYYLFQSGGGSGMPVWTHDYRKQVPVSGSTTDAYAAALNAAFGDIFTELTRDLAAADL